MNNKVLKGYKYRIYPTIEQREFLSQQFGSVRFIYNHFLANRKDEYLNNKKSRNYNDDSKELTKLKNQDGYNWLYDVNSQTLQATLRNLDIAYLRFFKKQSKFPKFHKRSNEQIIKIPQSFKVVGGNYLYIPKLKTAIKIKLHQPLPAEQISLHISKNPSGEYYVSFLCEVEIKKLPKNDIKIGIDLGLKNLVITSEGKTFNNHRFYKKIENKLKFEHKKLSNKKRSSKNRDKQRTKIAKLYKKITNCRKDQLHKLTYRLVNENQVIIAESLSVKNMIKNHIFAKSIQDAAWGELIRQLEYKSEWYGRIFYQIDRFFPSSKTCNNCQFVLDSLPLNIREWDCPNCNQHNDRDINAALNIRDKGLKDLILLSGSGIEHTDVKQKLAEALIYKSGRRSKKSSAPC